MCGDHDDRHDDDGDDRYYGSFFLRTECFPDREQRPHRGIILEAARKSDNKAARTRNSPLSMKLPHGFSFCFFPRTSRLRGWVEKIQIA